MLHFMCGEGVDGSSLHRAVELEDADADVRRPSVHACSGPCYWPGSASSTEPTRRCLRSGCAASTRRRGRALVHRFPLGVDPTLARSMADANADRRGRGGAGASTQRRSAVVRGADGARPVAAYAGDEESVRRDVVEADGGERATADHAGSVSGRWPMLGFLDVSLGNYEDAIETLKPLMGMLEAMPDSTEVIGASYVPDAAEALIQLGRPAEAEPLISALERNGQRLDRPWMKAVGARCRAHAARGAGRRRRRAVRVELALTEHERVPMPFERARTQLLAGQLQRRQRQKDQAATTLRDALKTFEDLNIRLWADRARAELAPCRRRHRVGCPTSARPSSGWPNSPRRA